MLTNFQLPEFKNRLIRAARLDAGLYSELRFDKLTLIQSSIVVVLSSLAAGLGGAAKFSIGSICVGTLVTLISWYLWAFIIYFVSIKLIASYETRIDFVQFLTLVGFSASVGILRILGFIPIIKHIEVFVGGVWMFAAMVVAVKKAFENQKISQTVTICVLSWLAPLIVITIILSLFLK
jgi:hypothetical protein